MGKRKSKDEELYRWLATVELADGTTEGVQFEEFVDLGLYLPDHFEVPELTWSGLIAYGPFVAIPLKNCPNLGQAIVDAGEIVESGPDWNDITSLELTCTVRPNQPKAVVRLAISLQQRSEPAQKPVLH